jgi:hypothetical protein
LSNDLNEDTVSSRASSVTEIFSDMNLINDYALQNCTQVLLDTIASDATLASNVQIASEITAAYNSVLEKVKIDRLYSSSSVSDSLLDDIYTSMALLAQGRFFNFWKRYGCNWKS